MSQNVVPPSLAMEAMLQAYRDPELAESLERDQADERAVVQTLLSRGVAAGQIDPGIDIPDAAAWVMTIIGAFYLQAATDTDFRPNEQSQHLRLLMTRFLRPAAT